MSTVETILCFGCALNLFAYGYLASFVLRQWNSHRLTLIALHQRIEALEGDPVEKQRVRECWAAVIESHRLNGTWQPASAKSPQA